ncbi:hypothetical protein QJS10_CPA08g01253 [Acorus calamus]|uniref:C2H2-type domain-containing protein n=1 Tax=Acorus calamus TaxID=4465 RepID=A0AAV9E7I8_ACOCL|nr:hypothetical protein QJS10_CPA08g01253 [Acorus calamus]
MAAAEDEGKATIFRDIRRYYCEYCGVCRSKKALIASHVLSVHKIEMKVEKEKPLNTCEECGASFKKPAYLKQHMLSHSLKRSFTCPVDDCHSNYIRQDHLNRHLLQHQGKLFTCPIENCNRRFAYQGNMTRHIKEMHDEEDPIRDDKDQKKHVCPEVGCGKAFMYASKLQKHEDSHANLDCTEVICGEPDCLKIFSNEECLKAHIQSCHRHVICEVCKTKQLRKNIKRHMRIHEPAVETEKIKCSYSGCKHSFSNKSNLNTHVKAVHLEKRPFMCRFAGCGQEFPYKHVRNNHEKSGVHSYVQGDFLESDEQFRCRPRGGRKRKQVTVESLFRKRVVPMSETSVLDDGQQYLRWLLSEDQQ